MWSKAGDCDCPHACQHTLARSVLALARLTFGIGVGRGSPPLRPPGIVGSGGGGLVVGAWGGCVCVGVARAL